MPKNATSERQISGLAVAQRALLRWIGARIGRLTPSTERSPSLLFVKKCQSAVCRWTIAVSSGLTSRPSLSGEPVSRLAHRRGGVVGINLPTFVERLSAWSRRSAPCACVVGINLPTFVERRWYWTPAPRAARVSSGLTSRPSLSGVRLVRFQSGLGQVSSGLTSRPSLSVVAPRGQFEAVAGVVGINLPTFVERWWTRRCGSRTARVSSGLTSRPSLSDAAAQDAGTLGQVSSGLTSRPSLSGQGRRRNGTVALARVVGINLPTFVERSAPARWRGRKTRCRRD